MNALAPEVASGKGRADENFPVGSRLIAAGLRPHVHAYYGFARAIDDIADIDRLAPEAKIARLDAMQALLLGEVPPAALSAAEPPAALSAEPPAALSADERAHALRLRASLAVTGIDPATATDLIVAFRRDAMRPRTESWDELVEYCRFSANPVGRYLLALHGEDAACLPASDALCTALQLLNHLQDCADDLANLDRCYIPEPWLAEEGLGIAALREPASSPALRRVLDRMLDEVDRLHAQAATLPALVADRRMRLEAAVIVGLSHRLASRLRREDPLAGRVRLKRQDVARSVLAAARAWRGRPPRAARTPLGCDAADLAIVAEIVTRSGTSFARGMGVLPADRRHAMYAIYAFCRLVDDVADEPGPFGGKLPRLHGWRARIAGLYAGQAGDALDRVLLAAIGRYDLAEADFAAIIDGMQMDAERVIVAPDEAELDRYIDRVACAVGRLSVRAFGDASAEADQVAHHLGRAMQITNILRDLGEDAQRGRLYLPLERLLQAGVPTTPDAALASPSLPVACRAMARRARGHFRAARAVMARCDRAAMRPARLMAATYSAILAAQARGGWRDPWRRVPVPAWRKALIVLRLGKF